MNKKEIVKRLNSIKRTTFGISVPELRKFARELARGDYSDIIGSDNYETFELKLLCAFLIGYIKDDIKTILKYFKKFIPFVDGWAVCDSLCQNFTIARKYPDIVWDFLMRYKNSKKEFESRIVAVVLLSHYLNDEYIDRVIDVLNNLNTDDYYSQMGVAWAFATICAKYPKKCLKYLKSSDCALDKTTFNKTLQKIRESFRVEPDIKKKALALRNLKG